MLRQYIGTFHVNTPDRVILRDLFNRMHAEDGTMKPAFTDRTLRRDTYREALAHHHHNQEFYYFVMSSH